MPAEEKPPFRWPRRFRFRLIASCQLLGAGGLQAARIHLLPAKRRLHQDLNITTTGLELHLPGVFQDRGLPAGVHAIARLRGRKTSAIQPPRGWVLAFERPTPAPLPACG